MIRPLGLHPTGRDYFSYVAAFRCSLFSCKQLFRHLPFPLSQHDSSATLSFLQQAFLSPFLQQAFCSVFWLSFFTTCAPAENPKGRSATNAIPRMSVEIVFHWILFLRMKYDLQCPISDTHSSTSQNKTECNLLILYNTRCISILDRLTIISNYGISLREKSMARLI